MKTKTLISILAIMCLSTYYSNSYAQSEERAVVIPGSVDDRQGKPNNAPSNRLAKNVNSTVHSTAKSYIQVSAILDDSKGMAVIKELSDRKDVRVLSRPMDGSAIMELSLAAKQEIRSIIARHQAEDVVTLSFFNSDPTIVHKGQPAAGQVLVR